MFVPAGRREAAELVAMIDMFEARCRANGVPLSPFWKQTRDACRQVHDRSRQQATGGDKSGRAAADPSPSDLMTVPQVAERFSVSRRTVERLIRTGRIPAVHVGRAVRVRLGDLGAVVDQDQP